MCSVINMKKDKIDMLLKDWRNSQQFRIACEISTMVKFNVRVLCNQEEYYAELEINKTQILIYPNDEERDCVLLLESWLEGCIENGSKGIVLNLRFGKPCFKLVFQTDQKRDQALKLIRNLLSDGSSDSSSMEENN